jgi:hypothetical protein
MQAPQSVKRGRISSADEPADGSIRDGANFLMVPADDEADADADMQIITTP